MPDTLTTESWPIDRPTLDPANARRHGERDLTAIAASLRRFGQQKPIIVNADGVVVAGNGTLEAARSLGWSEISVVVTDLPAREARAFAVADNRTAELSGWDHAALQAALNEFADDGDLLGATGFTEADIVRIGEAAQRDPELDTPTADSDAAAPPARSVNTEGQEATNEDEHVVEQTEDVTHRVIVSCSNSDEADAAVEALRELGLSARVIEL